MPLPKSFRTILQQNTALVFPVEPAVASCLPAEAQPGAPRQTPNPSLMGLPPVTWPSRSPQPLLWVPPSPAVSQTAHERGACPPCGSCSWTGTARRNRLCLFNYLPVLHKSAFKGCNSPLKVTSKRGRVILKSISSRMPLFQH